MAEGGGIEGSGIASPLSEKKMFFQEAGPSDFSLVGSLSMEDEIQYFFYTMKLLRLLRESKMAAAFEIAERIKSLLKGVLPSDSPAKLLLDMKPLVEEYEKELEDSDRSTSSSSSRSHSLHLSEESTDEEAEEEEEEVNDDETSGTKFFGRKTSNYTSRDLVPLFSKKESTPPPAPISLRSHQLSSPEEDLACVLSQIRDQRAASSGKIAPPVHNTSSNHLYHHQKMRVNDDHSPEEMKVVMKEKNPSSSYGGNSAAGVSPSIPKELRKEDVPTSLSDEKEKKKRKNRRRGGPHEQSDNMPTMGDDQNMKESNRKDGNSNGATEKLPLSSTCEIHLPSEDSVEVDIPLCEEDQRILEQLEKEVSREMERLAIIRRHR